MRRELKPILYEAFEKDSKLRLISIDLGYKFLDEIRNDFPDQFILTGASEQLAMGISIGLAEDGLIPMVYSITPFLLWRSAEWIRNYLDHENVPVKLLAAGRDNDYEHDGFSHYAGDDKVLLKCFDNIVCFWPQHEKELEAIFKTFLYNGKPSYLNLKR